MSHFNDESVTKIIEFQYMGKACTSFWSKNSELFNTDGEKTSSKKNQTPGELNII